MKTKNIDRRSISQIANAGKGNGDAKAEKKSESSNAGGKSSKKVDRTMHRRIRSPYPDMRIC